MKKLLLRFVIVSVLTSLIALNSLGQEFYDATNSPRHYYYNNLESATAGDVSTFMPAAGSVSSATSAIYLKSASSLNSTKSYSTVGITAGTIGYLRWNFMSNSGAAGLGLGGANYEWEFDYQSTSATAAADATLNMPIANSSTGAKDSWRYWLIANTYGVGPDNMTGLFVTVNNGNLKLITKYSLTNIADNNITIPLGNNTNRFQIRIVKSVDGYYYVYIFNRTTVSTTTYGPFNVGTSNTIDLNTYNYSYLEAASYAADRFQFDNFNFYRQRVDYVAINGSANGITTSLYPGIPNAIPYGVNVNVRGDIRFGRLVFSANANAQAIFADNSGVLYKTSNSTLSVAGGTPIVSNVGLYNNGTSQMTLPASEYYYNSGNTDGSTGNVIKYFLVAQGRNPFYGGYPTSITFSTSTIPDDNYQSFYNSTPPYTSVSGPASTGNSSTVLAAAPPTISYTTPQTLTVGTAASLTPTTTNSPTSYSTTGLPTGLSLNTSTGVISGTPTAGSSATNYSVTATNAGGSATTTINITVNGPPVISYATPQNYTVGAPIATLSPTNTSTAVGTFGFGAPSNFGSLTGIPYTVATDASGNIFTADYNAGTIYKYTSAGVRTTFVTGLVRPVNVAVDGLGNVWASDFSTNAVYKISASGTLLATISGFSSPFGIGIDASNNAYIADNGGGRIVRVPANTTGTVTGTTYVNGLTNPYGLTVDPTGNIYVSSNTANTIVKIAAGTTTTSTLIAAGSLSGPRNLFSDLQGNIYVSDYGNTAIKVIFAGSTTLTTALSTGLTQPRDVGVTGSGLMYIANSGTNSILRAIATGGYFISATLPTGLSFNSSTGQITGTPTVISPATNYTITGYNVYGSSSTVVSIAVSAISPPIVPAVSICGAGTATVAASGGTPTGGTYNFFTVATGGTALPNSTANTYITPFLAGGTTNYYVSYTVNGYTSARTAVAVTVNPEVSTPLSGGTFAYPLTGNANDVTGNLNTGNLQGAPSTTTDRFGNTGGAYSFNGSSQYISTTTSYVNPTTFSLSVWFNTTTTSGGKLIGFGNAQTGQSGSYDRHLYMDNTGKLIFGLYSGGAATISTPLSYNDGTWHHAIVTVSATSGSKIYMDGALIVTGATMTAPELNTGYWKIGYDNLGGWPNTPSSYFFNGAIDDVAVYNRELTATEVANANDINLIGLSTAFCPGNAVTLTAPTIAGATYSWTDGTTTQNTQTASFTGSSSAVYTLTVVANGCSSSATITPGAPTYQWTGAAGTVFNTSASNWRYLASGTTQAPTLNSGTESIIIPAGITNYPVLTTDRTIGSLTIESGATISLATFTLNVGCNIYNNNNTANGIVATGLSNGTITWNGNVAKQYYIGTNTTAAAQVTNMTMNNSTAGAALNISGGKIDISNALTITAGNIVVASSGTVTLKSSATRTAYVPSIPSAYSISGNVTVERWFTGGTLADRGWRLLSSPVNNSSTVPASSAATYNFSSLKQNLLVTGSGGSANGFDQPTGYTANGSTILFYNTSNALFTGPATINTTRNVGTGYYFFFRGNNTTNPVGKVIRSGGNFVAPEANVVGLQTGTLNQQGIVVSLSNAFRGFNLVGNPYPSSVTIPTTGALSTGNTTGFIWTFSPRGTSITARTGPFTVASGQGFYVKATGAGATLTFAESMKTATQPTTLLMSRPKTADALADVNTNALEDLKEANVELQLIQDSTNYDFAQLRFGSQYKNTYDVYEDADDLNGSGQAVFFGAMTSDKQLVAIASQPLDKQKTSVFLSVDDNTTGIYTIKRTDLSNIPSAYDVWLMDHFKKDSLDLRANDTYKFNLDKNNAATFGNSRFEVVIRKKMLPPYQLLSFNGARAGTDVQLNWNVQNEYDFTAFELQRSFDGTTFEAVRNMQSNSTGTYNFKDTYLPAGTKRVYYRLKQVDINDKVSYSNVIIVTVSGSGTFSLYPNPTSNTITFDIYKPVRQVRMNIFNAMGILMKTATFVGATGRADVSNFATGSYTIEVIDMDTRERVLNGKFIKN